MKHILISFFYLLKHMEGVDISEDIHTEEKTENLHKDKNK